MNKKILILILGVQSLLLLAVASWNEFSLRTGTVVLLEVQPVDPRDLLRGDYLVLNYKISEIPSSMLNLSASDATYNGAKVYVWLEKKGSYHVVKKATLQKIKPELGDLCLEGRLSQGRAGSHYFHINYGLESYFVPEGTGQPVGTLTAKVAITHSGTARIKEILINGKPYAEMMRKNS